MAHGLPRVFTGVPIHTDTHGNWTGHVVLPSDTMLMGVEFDAIVQFDGGASSQVLLALGL